MLPLQLVQPALQYLPSYKAALLAPWSPDNVRGRVAADEELAAIATDPEGFVAAMTDREAAGGPIVMPDGSLVPRLPGYRMWLWDGEFAGSIGFRWQPGTASLPDHVLGHIGYAVVPWKQGRGYASRALGLLLPRARKEGLPYVELATDLDNEASQKVILKNGGVLVCRFTEPIQYGGEEGYRFRIDL